MGFKPAARLAGIYPKTRPIAAETPKETSTAGSVAAAFICIRLPAAGVITHPSAMPTSPPMELVTAASMTNC